MTKILSLTALLAAFALGAAFATAGILVVAAYTAASTANFDRSGQ